MRPSSLSSNIPRHTRLKPFKLRVQFRKDLFLCFSTFGTEDEGRGARCEQGVDLASFEVWAMAISARRIMKGLDDRVQTTGSVEASERVERHYGQEARRIYHGESKDAT